MQHCGNQISTARQDTKSSLGAHSNLINLSISIFRPIVNWLEGDVKASSTCEKTRRVTTINTARPVSLQSSGRIPPDDRPKDAAVSAAASASVGVGVSLMAHFQIISCVRKWRRFRGTAATLPSRKGVSLTGKPRSLCPYWFSDLQIYQQ